MSQITESKSHQAGAAWDPTIKQCLDPEPVNSSFKKSLVKKNKQKQDMFHQDYKAKKNIWQIVEQK